MSPKHPTNGQNPSGVHDEPMRDRIAQCAIQLFATQGYAATSMREIVEAVGVTKPTLYYYFDSKETLYTTLLHERLDLFYSRLFESARETGRLEDRLGRIVRVYFETMLEMPHMARLFLRSMLGSSPHQPAFDHDRYAKSMENLVFDIFRDAVNAGEIPPALLRPFLAVEFLGLVLVFVLRNAIGYEDNLTAEKARLVVQLFMKGLRGLAEDKQTDLSNVLREEGFERV